MTDTVDSTLNGKKISFQSKYSKDTTLWKGTVVGTATYAYAKLNADVLSYYSYVKKEDSTIGDVDTLSYFIIILDNDSSVQQTHVFANEWISSGTLQVIEEDITVTIEVYDTETANHNNIISVLKSAGYKAVIKSIS